MKRIITKILPLLFCFQMIAAQEVSLTDTSVLTIPTLTDILNAALQHSPLLKAKILEKRSIEKELKIEKKAWMDYIFIEGAANYGLFDQVVISGLNSEGTSTTGLLTKSEQGRYYGGVGVKLPLSSLTNRKSETAIKRLAIEQTEYQYREIQKEIKLLIIEEYYKLQYLHESLKTFQAIYQTMEIGFMKAERELLNGRMDLNEYALLASTVGKAKDDYFKAKSNFYAQYHKLQDLSGIIF